MSTSESPLRLFLLMGLGGGQEELTRRRALKGYTLLTAQVLEYGLNAPRITGAMEKTEYDNFAFFGAEVNGIWKPPKQPTAKFKMQSWVQQGIPQ